MKDRSKKGLKPTIIAKLAAKAGEVRDCLQDGLVMGPGGRGTDFPVSEDTSNNEPKIF